MGEWIEVIVFAIVAIPVVIWYHYRIATYKPQSCNCFKPGLCDHHYHAILYRLRTAMDRNPILQERKEAALYRFASVSKQYERLDRIAATGNHDDCDIRRRNLVKILRDSGYYDDPASTEIEVISAYSESGRRQINQTR